MLTFPFEFLQEKLSVFFNFEGIKFEFSIESLLALMVMNLKADAEKQFSKMMSNIVITIPTNYNLIQKNAIRNVAKIAGFEDIELITELSSAAVGYACDKSRHTYSNFRRVLFVIINRYDCDVALCNIIYNKIQFVAYYHQNLNLIERGSTYIPKFITNRIQTYWSGSDHKKLTFKRLEFLIERALHKKSHKRKDIDECVIAGDSQLISDVKVWMNSYFGLNKVFECDPIGIIINGSTIYSAMLSKKIPIIEATEVTNFPIYVLIKPNKCNSKNEKVLDEN